jgi:SAM-dependent methyltransferase
MCATLRGVTPRVARASADALPFGDGTFDGAVCNHVLYHLADPAAGLRELHRVVRPGGWVAVATNGTGHMREVSGLAVAAGLPAADVHEHFPAERAAAAMREHFDDVETHRYDDTLEVPSAEPVLAYVASLAGRPLTAAETAVVATAAPYRIGKHTVLVTARRGVSRAAPRARR